MLLKIRYYFMVDPILKSSIDAYQILEQQKVEKNVEIQMIKKTLELQKEEGEMLSRMLLELQPQIGQNINIEV